MRWLEGGVHPCRVGNVRLLAEMRSRYGKGARDGQWAQVRDAQESTCQYHSTCQSQPLGLAESRPTITTGDSLSGPPSHSVEGTHSHCRDP